MADQTAAPNGEHPPPIRTRSIWQSRTLRLALTVTVIGLVAWVYAAITRPAAVPASANAAQGFSSMTSQFGVGEPAPPASRFIDEASPAAFRLGSSFVVGFFIAWAAKKFIKVSILIAGACLLGYYALHKAGIVTIESDTVHSAVDRSLAWVKGEASGFKDFVLGYVPSAAAGAAGIVFGARRA